MNKQQQTAEEESDILQHYVQQFEYRHCGGTCDCNQAEDCPWTSIELKGVKI